MINESEINIYFLNFIFHKKDKVSVEILEFMYQKTYDRKKKKKKRKKRKALGDYEQQ